METSKNKHREHPTSMPKMGPQFVHNRIIDNLIWWIRKYKI